MRSSARERKGFLCCHRKPPLNSEQLNEGARRRRRNLEALRLEVPLRQFAAFQRRACPSAPLAPKLQSLPYFQSRLSTVGSAVWPASPNVLNREVERRIRRQLGLNPPRLCNANVVREDPKFRMMHERQANRLPERNAARGFVECAGITFPGAQRHRGSEDDDK